MANAGYGAGALLEGFIAGRNARNKHRRDKLFEKHYDTMFEDEHINLQNKKDEQSDATTKRNAMPEAKGRAALKEPKEYESPLGKDPIQRIWSKLFGPRVPKQAIDPDTPPLVPPEAPAPETLWNEVPAPGMTGTEENPFTYDSYAPQMQTYRYADGGIPDDDDKWSRGDKQLKGGRRIGATGTHADGGMPDPADEEELRAAMAAEELQNALAAEEAAPPTPAPRAALQIAEPPTKPVYRGRGAGLGQPATPVSRIDTGRVFREQAEADLQRELAEEEPASTARAGRGAPPVTGGRGRLAPPVSAAPEPWQGGGGKFRGGRGGSASFAPEEAAPTTATTPPGVRAPTGGVSPDDPAAIDIDAEKEAFFDLSKLPRGTPASQIPNFKTEDWVQHRLDAMDTAIRRGAGFNEAYDFATDKVTAMQQKGFMNYAMAGFMAQQAGNYDAAKLNYRAAWQYLPNGQDAEFGTIVGKDGKQHIIGFGRDEQTGELIVGSEKLMDPEMITTFIETMKNPAAFRSAAKDHREWEQKMREYYEKDKPMAEEMMNYYGSRGAALDDKSPLTQSSMQADDRAFMSAVEDIIVDEEDGQEKALALVAQMQQVKRRYPDAAPSIIAHGVRQIANGQLTPQQFQRQLEGSRTQAPSAPATPSTALPVEPREEALGTGRW